MEESCCFGRGAELCRAGEELLPAFQPEFVESPIPYSGVRNIS